MARSQCRPADLASSILGRTPAVITTRSAGITVPSLKRTAVTRSGPTISSVCAFIMKVRPLASSAFCSSSAAGLSSCWFISASVTWTTVTDMPWRCKPLAAFQPQQAAADDDRVAVVARHRQHGFDILDIAEGQHAAQLMARHRNDERLGAGGDQQAVVAHFQAGTGAHDAIAAINVLDRIAGMQRDAMLDVPLARVEH